MGEIMRRVAEPFGRWSSSLRDQDAAQQPHGTKWGRGAAVLLASLGVTSVIGVAVLEGAVATSFNVGNQKLSLHVDSLSGEGLGAVVTTVTQKTGENQTQEIAVLRAALNNAKLSGLCLTAPQTILGATYSVLISAPSSEQAGGKNVVFDVEALGASPAALSNAIIGRSADEIFAAGQNLGGVPGGFGLDVTGGDVTLDNVEGKAYAAQILGQLDLPELSLSLAPGEPDHC